MPPKAYLETSILSYLTARPSADVVIAAHQQITTDWWQTKKQEFDLYASQLVLQEASAGDPIAAQDRQRVAHFVSQGRGELTERRQLLVLGQASSYCGQLFELALLPFGG